MDPKSLALAALLQCSEKDIDEYKRWIGLPLENTVFNASNARDWMSLDKYHDNYHPETQPNDADIIDISSDDEPPNPPAHNSQPAPIDIIDIKPVLNNIINLCDSDSDADIRLSIKSKTKSEPLSDALKLSSGRFPKAKKINISRTEKVDRVVELLEIPERFPVPEVDTAFILDFSGDERAKRGTKGGKPKGLNAILKEEDQDSWGKGSNGRTVLGNIPTCRSTHKCNGAYKCQFFDSSLLEGYERINADNSQPAPIDIIDIKPVLNNIINLCDSDSDADIRLSIKSKTKSEPLSDALKLSSGRFPKAKKINISRTEKVDRVVELLEIPERFPVPEVDTAFILDFSGDERAKRGTKGGKPKGLNAILKEEDQDSWGKGSNGRTVLGNIPTCRSTHKCNGAYKCQFFDSSLLEGYERINAEDRSLMRKIFDRQLTQNQTDTGSAVGKTASFFRVVQRYKMRGCPKAGCSGVPTLRNWRDGPSADGKNNCTGWTMADPSGHTYAVIPPEATESILATHLNGSAVPPLILEDHGDDNGLCAYLMHPRHGKESQCLTESLSSHPPSRWRACGRSNGGARMSRHEDRPHVERPQRSKMCRNLPRAPLPSAVAPGEAWEEAKDDVKKAALANGILGQTGGKLNNGPYRYAPAICLSLIRLFKHPGTYWFLSRVSLRNKHPAYRDTRRLRNDVAHLKHEETPAGLLWAGIVADYESNRKLPLADRYIHHIQTINEIKIAVTMVPALAALLHDKGVMFLEGDITFKRTQGELNEWEAAICQGITIARIWVNSFTKEAFTNLFDAFFKVVKQVTGKSVKFKAFYPDGNLYSIHFDMEAAQVQGFGAWLMQIVADDPKLHNEFRSLDGDELVQYVLKLCSVRLERLTDELVPHVGRETVKYLNLIRGLSDPADINNYHNFCKNSPNKKL
ncbi:hypothetical protein R3P38DRAFT_3219590 [Favolaschia claudopus]|uniref:Uncharacterized protein n=1 Tax=Favolaschia claudopus TaxID=2862362 RepID=A0AAW0A1T0_9AGAR